MTILLCILVGVLAFVVSVFGFSQIIGSLQNIKKRGSFATIVTILIWAVILFLGWWLMQRFAPAYAIVYYIATGIGFVMVLSAGKIE